jgi:flagellar biosynthesis protein FlhF
MQAKRFIAADMRRALDMVKEEFGEDAMIVSTERTSRGVEIVASLEASMQSLINNSEMANMSVSPHQQNIANAAARFTTSPIPSSSLQTAPTVGFASGKTKQELADEMELANRRMLASRKADNMTIGEWANQAEEKPKEKPLPTMAEEPTDAREIQRLHHEISEMRNTLEIQLSQMADTQERQYIESLSHINSHPIPTESTLPIVGEIKYQLELMGLPKACNDQLISAIKDNNMPVNNKQLLWTHVLAGLAKGIPSIHTDPVAQGGIYSFLGMTGVGKTTTIAKLAARYVMQHGAEGVVLLTTDNYRIAAHNQLQSLAKILNVTVKVIDDLKEIPDCLEEYKHYPLVLIDTPGMSYTDPLLKPHLQMFKQCPQINNILVLSANSQYQMIKASLHSYRLAGLSYCILTKLDECAHLGDAIGVLFEQELPLAYITDGQAVPQDISVLKSSQLVSRAVNMVKLQRKNKWLEQQSI